MVTDHFTLNGVEWTIDIVPKDSQQLMDRTGKLTVATTDPIEKTVYLSESLRGIFLVRVLIHELGHCSMISFGLLERIHEVVYPEYWIEAEEWICNYLVDYGILIFETAYSVLGYKAWELIPKEIEKIIKRGEKQWT